MRRRAILSVIAASAVSVGIIIVTILILESYLSAVMVISRHPHTTSPPRRNTVNFVITAYTCGPESTGKTPADPGYCITATGHTLSDHDSYKVVAADPDHYPAGTVLHIAGIGKVKVLDTGDDITGHNRLDLFVGKTNVESAILFGRREMPGVVYTDKEKGEVHQWAVRDQY